MALTARPKKWTGRCPQLHVIAKTPRNRPCISAKAEPTTCLLGVPLPMEPERKEMTQGEAHLPLGCSKVTVPPGNLWVWCPPPRHIRGRGICADSVNPLPLRPPPAPVAAKFRGSRA